CAVVCGPGAAEEIARAAESQFVRAAQAAGATRPQVTIVNTTVTPQEAGQLEGAFRRLARVRREARDG
ncbi:MAG: hypothetical protein ACOCX2_06600, partial [Armatimonadota bacterium]